VRHDRPLTHHPSAAVGAPAMPAQPLSWNTLTRDILATA
jgi:hypothetical protein